MDPPPRAPSVDAFGERLVAELPALRAFAARLLAGTRGGLDAEDVMQEVGARALKFQDRFDGERPVGPWLRRMAVNVVIDARRRRAALVLAEADEPRIEDVDHAAHEDEVRHLLGRLAETERDVLVRFHARGESIKEIGRALVMPDGTVKSHLHRARRNLLERGR